LRWNPGDAETKGGNSAYFLDSGNVCFGGKPSVFCANIAIWLNFLHEFWSFESLTGAATWLWPTGFLNLANDRRGIRLESAA
jgi:hypothetical protein